MTVKVMTVDSSFESGQDWRTMCKTVIVEKHKSCSCSCLLNSNGCESEIHTFNANECQCICHNDNQRPSCMSEGKFWNNHLCRCECREPTVIECSTGFVFDSVNTCECIRTSSDASNSTNLIVLIVSMVSASSLIMLIFFDLKRRVLKTRKSQKFPMESTSIHKN